MKIIIALLLYFSSGLFAKELGLVDARLLFQKSTTDEIA